MCIYTGIYRKILPFLPNPLYLKEKPTLSKIIIRLPVVLHNTDMILKVVITPDTEDGGYTVSCPALPGCHSQGETREEALENIKDAIQGCIAVLNDRAGQQRGSTVVDVTV